jgi:hypothetical protein
MNCAQHTVAYFTTLECDINKSSNNSPFTCITLLSDLAFNFFWKARSIQFKNWLLGGLSAQWGGLCELVPSTSSLHLISYTRRRKSIYFLNVLYFNITVEANSTFCLVFLSPLSKEHGETIEGKTKNVVLT